ncbi:MAG: hypothetical protein HGB10_00300 [Coriobacteriia bacterium]|nr:hypothetical protein [Coriobacteriia bacterium]
MTHPAEIPDTEFDDLFEHLPVKMQQAIARGDVELDQVLERLTRPSTGELCPSCSVREVDHESLGLCWTCARKAMNEAFEKTIVELEAKREADRLKKGVQRLRDDLDPDRSRRPKKGSTT